MGTQTKTIQVNGTLTKITPNLESALRHLRHTATPLPYSTEAAAADDIFHWLRKTVKFRATDPRDKIFALLGMARSKAWRDLQPDYSKSLEELMYSLVLRMICTDGNLEILTLCGPKLEPYRPRLSAHKDSTSANITTRTGDTRCNDSYLSVSGFVVDRVGHLTKEHTALLPNQDKEFLERTGHKHGVGADVMSLRSLYYWYPIWRALDPAYWQFDDNPGAAAFIQGLSRYLKVLQTRPKARQSPRFYESVEGLKRDSIVGESREILYKAPP